MTTMLETPSRIWRRIEAIEHRDMPSLPSLPPFEDSAEEEEDDISEEHGDKLSRDFMMSAIHSTPTTTHHTATSTLPGGNTSSTERFANSIASRSNRSSRGFNASPRSQSLKNKTYASFEVPSLPTLGPTVATGPYSDQDYDDDDEGVKSKSSVPDIYLPPEEDENGERDFSLTEALESISRESSPPLHFDITREETPKKNQEISASFRSEAKPSPLEKYRNVALRRTNPRARTPSLTRTSSSDASSPPQTTPQSTRSFALPRSQTTSPIPASAIPLPRSRTASPAVVVVHRPEEDDEMASAEQDISVDTQETRSMDITDVHISPPRLDADSAERLEPDLDQTPFQHEVEQSQDTQEDPEPTFSTESDVTPYAINSRLATVNASSMQSPSLAFTPTPAFPRPRARFNLPAVPSELLSTPALQSRTEDENEATPSGDIVPSTPYNRPSFLLSVIHSTARPKMAAGTPHPHKFGSGTPSIAESTPAASGSANDSAASPNPQSAFANVTRRPRIGLAPRVSHPLSQAISAGASSGSDTSSPISAGGSQHVPWATPSPHYDGTADKASFISTASSHDLTTHQRGNTSFDPAMGFGAGQGVGRFNAGKLNTYLHGLNRRLQEENEVLVERLRQFEEGKKSDAGNASPGADDSGRRLSGGTRRRSSIGTVLGDVKEEMAEGWLEEKAEMEEMLEAYKEDLAACNSEKAQLEQALLHEQEERETDNARWKERLEERVQESLEGASKVVEQLDQKLKNAEDGARKMKEEANQINRAVRNMENVLAEVEGERDDALERASKAENLLESGKDDGGALADANERIAQLMADVRNTNGQVKGLEDEVMQSDARIDELEKEVKNDKRLIRDLEEELGSREDALADERAKISQLESVIRELDIQLQETKAYADELEQGAGDIGQEIHELKLQLGDAKEKISTMATARDEAAHGLETMENEAQAARKRERQLEEAVEAAEDRMLEDEEVIIGLKNRLASLERQKDLTSNSSRSTSKSSNEIVFSNSEYEALEQELDEANREKARLRALLDQSPARKAIEKAKNLKIEMLEREKEELLERNKALRSTVNEFTTPNKVLNSSGITPIHRQVLNMSIKVPKTPGGPLRDMSWLNSTGHDPSLTPLVSEIRRLQGELDRANDSIDDKLDKLEDAGLGVIGLTEKLEAARSRIITLEDEIADLKRKGDRRLRRLAHVRCQKCNIKVDFERITQADESSVDVSADHLPTEPPTPPTRTSEALKANLQSINAHLEELKNGWETEKKKLLGEKAVLEDAATRLNNQIKTSRAEAKKAVDGNRAVERAKTNVQTELDKAKQTIAVLENELSQERTKLRSVITEQERMHREKKQIMTDMQRTEGDMDGVKQQMQRLKKENQSLEKELRENANAEQRARLLETRVIENTDTIEQLRQERMLLAADHKELQQRFSEVTETANKLRNKHASMSTSHDNRRHELDMHLHEIDELKKALDDRAASLQRVSKEKEKLSVEKNNVAQTVAALESDLRRVKKDAEAFGRDLKLLRDEKEKLQRKNEEEIAKGERAKKQAQAQIRIITEQLDTEKDRVRVGEQMVDEWRAHVCAPSADANQIGKLKLQHNKECKGLIVQIRYLKAKFTRESLFRDDLTYQKHYLLVLLRQFEKSEHNIFVAIARIGFPVPPTTTTTSRRRSLKAAALVVIFLNRVKKSSAAWRVETSAKKSVAAALEDVRRRRAIAASDPR
ncbi:hypothetical protein CPB83DRAFT_850794 [Crepidotus variabilis]|uniref:Pericentrin/AKAP-450 centrosomal targeting domain-containing protein n=1 Tax=Crepidotus variabilis TaxID=179855 RepID=A0A9P6JRK9_9AGAR|nr:hypothetical protein CPB83DRAFT_850794 [Crepidotus variabilis]